MVKRFFAVGAATLLLLGAAAATAQRGRMAGGRRAWMMQQAGAAAGQPVRPGRALAGMPARDVGGDEAAAATQWLTTHMKWQSDLAQAEAAAKKDGKLVFWVHMLGQMDGAT
jgi:hypothetical protein